MCRRDGFLDIEILQRFEHNIPQDLGVKLTPLPVFKPQKRKRQAKSSMPEWKICGADTETIHGKVWIFSTEFGAYEVETLADLMDIMFDKDHARSWKKSRKSASKNGTLRGLSSKEFFFWNLKFDAQAIIKLMCDEAIEALIGLEGKVRVNADTGDFTEVAGRMLEFDYLEGKLLRIKPIKWYDGRYKYGEINWWDISQFYYKIRLNSAAQKYLDKSKIEHCFDGSVLDASRFDEKEYRDFYREDIDKYAIVDAELAGELTRLCREDFISQDIRFIQPYSLANVAQRALLDTCTIPTINEYYTNPELNRLLQYAHTSFHGGWFETKGSGFKENIKAYDLASAYPYVMYHLPDTSRGIWIEGDIESEWWEWIEARKPYSPGFAEATIRFEPGMEWHPLVQKASSGTLVSPRFITGWFTADELAEARKWPHTHFIVGRWFYHFDDQPQYPFRKFIERFYKIKMESAGDPIAYRVAKVALNSIYGKTVQAVENEIGKLWNPFYSSTITGGTRARLAEFNRLNGTQSVSFATDGIILPPEAPGIVPPRPLPAPYNLGEWEDDGEGDVLIVMSGVYSIRKADNTKTTFRGSASYFVRPYHTNGLFEFCEVNDSARQLSTMVTKPWSAKEARQRSDYSLINVFEARKFTMSAMGDSNKRMWLGDTPKTFGDLLNNWFDSKPQERLL
jgi:hypothetical protein